MACEYETEATYFCFGIFLYGHDVLLNCILLQLHNVCNAVMPSSKFIMYIIAHSYLRCQQSFVLHWMSIFLASSQFVSDASFSVVSGYKLLAIAFGYKLNFMLS